MDATTETPPDGGEPLARSDDAAAYRAGLRHYRSGAWDEAAWGAFRLRHGVYAQRQPDRQMVRIKIPGGVVPLSWLPVLGELARDVSSGTVHLTTRQDIQLYDVALERTPEVMERLFRHGLTSRDAGGNTVRNITACDLAGVCPHQRVDAGRVAEQLARSWLRRPLAQALPRKLKVTVSGCGADCGGATFHDLGLIAVERDGRPGFRVLVGGGLGAMPTAAIEMIDFVAETDLPRVLETVLRLHVRHSSRTERGRARIKFTLKRMGEAAFRDHFATTFTRLEGLDQRPWPPLDWHRPAADALVRPPLGVLTHGDGRLAVVVPVPLGLLDARQLDGLYALARDHGLDEIRLTRQQTLVLPGIAAERRDDLTAGLAALGLTLPAPGQPAAGVLTCPGAATCRIGITTSRALGQTIATATEPGDATRVHVSGCHNGCALHAVADIGLHGVSKTIDGRVAPHYRLHVGGEAGTGRFGIEGPVIPARRADQAVTLLRRGIAAGRADGESVRDWATRIGPDGLADLLAPLLAAPPTPDLFTDWGAARPFTGPARATGECAAPTVGFGHLSDLAADALDLFDRFLAAGRWDEALKAAEQAVVLAIRRLLSGHGVAVPDDEGTEGVFARFRASPVAVGQVLEAFDAVLAERTSALVTGGAQSYREAVSWLIDSVTPPVGAA